jgi:outer membrane protein TolC
MKRWLWLISLAPALAGAADYPDLPPAELAEKALRNHPAVVAAQAGIGVGEAARDQFEAGPYEFNLRLGKAQRREIASDLRLPEKQVGIERAVRLPGKAAKDAEIGTAVLEQAQGAYGDTLHETGRLLLKSWFDWRREQAAVDEWRTQADILRQQSDIAAKRVAAGDAAQIELLLTSAQQAQTEAQLAQAENRAQFASGVLAQHFPSLPLPAHIGAAAPQPISQTFESWREAFLEHNHELQLARATARRQQLQAQRTDADRLPDPTVGVTWSSERDGQERVIGVALSIPLPGGARSAAARGAQAESSAAAAREAQTLAKVEGDARRIFQAAQAAYLQWQRLADAASRIAENTRLLEKAWRFGEGQIGDLLVARRQAVEARLAAAQAQLDATEARYRLLLDTHRLWALDGGELSGR